MPLSDIKSALEFVKETPFNDINKVKKHLEQLSHLMLHLDAEMEEFKPILKNLNEKQKDALFSRLSPRCVTLAHSLLLPVG